jgi:hypothetical protein
MEGQGDIVSVGQQTFSGDQSDMAIHRFHQEGTEDFNWQNNDDSPDFFGHNDVARDALIQPDGKVVLVGWAAQSGSGSLGDLVVFALARLDADGTRDATFGDDAEFGANSYQLVAGFGFGYDAALGGVLQPDGDIVAAGGSDQAALGGLSAFDFAVARFTGPGAVAPTDFKAQVRPLRPFELQAYPEKFTVSWTATGAPTPPTFDVRTRTAHWSDRKFEAWKLILGKTKKTKKDLTLAPGNTICIQARANAGGFTTPWSEEECTATPVDDRTLDQIPSSGWGEYHRDDCYRNTYLGSGHGVGAEVALDATFRRLAVVIATGSGVGLFGTIEVLVDGKAVKTISEHGGSIHCGVLEAVKVYPKAAQHEVVIRHVKTESAVFIDGLGLSLA